MAGHRKSLAVRISTMVDKLRARPRGVSGLDHAIQAQEPAATAASDLIMSSAIQVNSSKPVELFDNEIMKQLGRHFEHRSDELNDCMRLAPEPFTVKLLQEFIGEHIRKNSGDFARRMHASIDTLLEECEAIGNPKERLEVLGHLCHALAKRRYSRDHFIPRKQTEALLTTVAFVVALAAQYDEVAVAMVKAGKIKVNEKTQDFGSLIDMAIVLGNVQSAKMLLGYRAALDIRRWSRTCLALSQAAAEGDLDMVSLILGWLPPDQDHETYHTYGRVMCKAAEYQQWKIVRHILEMYVEEIQIEEGKPLLCLAAKYGQDDIIRMLLEPDMYLYDCNYPESKSFPLREVAAGGYLSTCLLLIEKDLTKSVGPGRGEVVARFIAKGGNIDLYHRLKELKPGLWKDWHEVHFLPIAAQAGHLDFVKFAVDRGNDRRPKPNHRKPPAELDWEGEIRYPDDVRYFALLCAVVSGHLDVVRWFVQELGVDVDNKAGLGGDRELLPAILAVFAGQVEMVKLLRTLGARPVPEDMREKLWDVQNHTAMIGELKRYRRALHLRDDYKFWHPFSSKATTAWSAAVVEQ